MSHQQRLTLKSGHMHAAQQTSCSKWDNYEWTTGRLKLSWLNLIKIKSQLRTEVWTEVWGWNTYKEVEFMHLVDINGIQWGTLSMCQTTGGGCVLKSWILLYKFLVLVSMRKQCRPRSDCSWVWLLLIMIWVCTIWHSVYIFWTHFCMLNPHYSNFRIITTVIWDVQILTKKLIEMSRVCHNHKPQPTLDTKRKRKRTKTCMCKTNKQMYEKHKDQLLLLQAR